MTRFGALPVDPPALLPLRPHPPHLTWPTAVWPREGLDSRVDRAALERTLDHAFTDPEPDDLGRTNAVVVVQHGAIVAERYRQDADAAGSLGLFYSGAFGQRILISPKLDLIVVRVGNTPPQHLSSVVRYCKELIDLFRPTAS